MPALPLADLLRLKDVSFPKILFITDEVCVSAQKVVEHLVKQLIVQQQKNVHYVMTQPLAHMQRQIITDCPMIKFYFSAYEKYEEDECPFEAALSILRKSMTKKQLGFVCKNNLYALDAPELLSGPCIMDYRPPTPGITNDSTFPERDYYNSDSNLTDDDANTKKKATLGGLSNCVLVIDKLHDVLRRHSAISFLRHIKKLTQEGCLVLLWGGMDCIWYNNVSSMLYSASAHLHVNPTGEQGWDAVGTLDIARKTSSKTISTREKFHISSNGVVKTEPAPRRKISALLDYTVTPTPSSSSNFSSANSVAQSQNRNVNPINRTSNSGNSTAQQRNVNITPSGRKVAPKIEVEVESEQKPRARDEDPDSFLSSQTFSLTLSDKEREAKNSLLLPHQRIQSGDGGGGGGSIHYVPDREDWDEEDPDDDLDI